MQGMPFLTLLRIQLLLTNRGLLYRIHSQFYRVYIHSTPSIVSVVKHYLSLPSRTHQDPQTSLVLCTPTTLHPGLPPPLAQASGTFFLGTSTLDWNGWAQWVVQRNGQREAVRRVLEVVGSVCSVRGGVFDVPKSFLSCGLCTL